MQLYAPISKVDSEERMVWGYASTDSVDDAGEIITREALAGAIDDYMRYANIREMHSLSAVGVAKEASIDDRGLYIAAKIVDDAAWAKIVEGVYKGFSVGGRALARDPNNRKVIVKMALREISIVDRPANPEAVFDCWKAADGPGDNLMDQSAEELVAAFNEGREIEMPDSVEKTEATDTDDAVEKTAETTEETADATDDVAKGDEPGTDPADTVEKTAEEDDGIEIDADLIKVDEAGEDDPVVKRSFSAAERRAAAKSGSALKDGSFPIANKEDLQNAIHAVGRAKDPEAAKAHIKRRAKALGAESMLPDSWKGRAANKAAAPEDNDVVKTEEAAPARHVPGQVWTCGDPTHNHVQKADAVRCVDQADALAKAASAVKPQVEAVARLRDAVDAVLTAAGKDPAEIAKAAEGEPVRKGLMTLSSLAYMVLQMRDMVCSVDYEESAEGDDGSKLPQMMRDALVAMVSAMKEMTAEETTELLDSVATNTAMANHSADFLYLAVHIDDIAKAGARNSRADMDRLQKAHDALVGLGAICKADGDDMTDKVMKAFVERDAEISELRKAFDDVVLLNGAISTIGETIADIRKTASESVSALEARIAEQADEIAKLSAQPVPAKTAANVHVVEKAAGDTAVEDDDALLERISKMSDEDITLTLIKAAHKNPKKIFR